MSARSPTARSSRRRPASSTTARASTSMATDTQWRQRIAVEALLEFIAPLADIAEGFRWDAEQTRKRGLHLLAADLFRFAKSVKDIERRARWALHEFSK